MPDSPEAWFDLAAIESALGKPDDSFPALRRALALSDGRLQKDPKAANLRLEVQNDPRFQNVRNLPQFKEITGQR